MDDKGNLTIVPAFTIEESTAVIQNALFPQNNTGQSFASSFTVTKLDESTLQVTAEGEAKGTGSLLDFIGIQAKGSVEYNLFSFDESVTAVSVTLKFNGVTTVTPEPAAYDISTGTGWFNPQPIQNAVGNTQGESGYQFTPNPGLNFQVNGNFGLISRLLISQQPTVTMEFENANYNSFSQIIQQGSKWGISFLGIQLGASQSYFQADVTQDSQSNMVVVTMTPPATVAPVNPLDQLAYVIGAEVNWPGAPA